MIGAMRRFVCLRLICLFSVTGALTSPRTEHVCESIEVRNHLEEFRKLDNCTVIEGYLQILLIEYSAARDFEQLSFPDLREITDYLLLYRVYGLRTLSHVFPNLSVVRGQRLFYNYALVVFEMPDLESLGLGGLTRIVRGAVRIEKNPRLCYVDTINWSAILSVNKAGSLKADNFILQNKDVYDCVNVCPRNADGGDVCPVMDAAQKYKQPLCWNENLCQRICPNECSNSSMTSVLSRTSGSLLNVDSQHACYYSEVLKILKCCHPECLGGCTGPTDRDCLVCVHVFYNGRCLPNCPRNMYELHGRRCLEESECRAKELVTENGIRPYKILSNGQCALECLPGFMENREDRNLCEKCIGRCPKVCPEITIDNVETARQLKGCTIINGVLEIQIRGGDQVGIELEESLDLIEEITGYLKIVRSHALLSLRFLKNLRVIHGERLFRDRYAFYLLDNENLQDIWDFNTHPRLAIEHGSLFFHFNRKLCYSKIEDFARFVGMADKIDDADVSQTDNGDQVACDITKVNLSLYFATPTHAVITWSKHNLSDERQVLSWIINIRQVDHEPVTIYDARDACATNGLWKVIDHPDDKLKTTVNTAAFLLDLEPFTRYAVYVQTYMIMTAKTGARSDILYFTTSPDRPSPARDIVVNARYPGEIHLSWKPPSKPNGNVTHYNIFWHPQPLAREQYMKRDYCVNKIHPQPKLKVSIVADNVNNQTSLNGTSKGQCCQCPKSPELMKKEDEERRFQIQFENYLQDNLYRKHQPSRGAKKTQRKRRSVGRRLIDERLQKRRKRQSVADLDILRLATQNSMYSALLNNYTAYGNLSLNETDTGPAEQYEGAVVYGKLEFIITNLKHFQEYSIEVIACHDLVEGADSKLCSNRAIIVVRTQPNDDADTIDPRNITVNTDVKLDESGKTGVYIGWLDPVSPNGLVVHYDLELVKAEVANYKPEGFCIPYQDYIKHKGFYVEYRHLSPGNWSFRIRTTSLAGNGSWTNYQYFFIPFSQQELNLPVIICISLFVCLLLTVFIIVLVMMYLKRRQDKRMSPDGLYVSSQNPTYVNPEDGYKKDEFEVPRDKIRILREIGQGSFGMVYEGIARDLVPGELDAHVAVKTTNEKASLRDRIAFLNEASVMKAFNCHHIIKLLGVVSDGHPTLVIMELMAKGDLKNYLRMHRPDEEDNNGRTPLTLPQIVQMAGEIADGMAYLSSKKFVHRDLAARNCMVAEDLTVKIGDFGMTRDIYETDYYRKGTKGLLPVRWMPPESLKDGFFDSQSDVWSYGVVLWEMATLAAQPYQGLSHEEVMKFVGSGGIMSAPEGCPRRLYDLMVKCWKFRPKERPTFIQIIEEFEPDLSAKFHEVSFYFNAEPTKDSTLENAPVNDDDDLELVHSKTPLNPTERTSSQKLPSPRQSPRKCPETACDSAGDPSPSGLMMAYLPSSEPPKVNGTVNTSKSVTDSLLNHSTGNTVPARTTALCDSEDRNKTSNTSDVGVNNEGARPKDRLANGHIPYRFLPAVRAEIKM